MTVNEASSNQYSLTMFCDHLLFGGKLKVLDDPTGYKKILCLQLWYSRSKLIASGS